MIPARDHARRTAALPCDACDAWTETPLEDGAGAVACSGCGAPIPCDLAARLDADGALDGCPRCAYHTLYVQKDVNPRLGVAIVVVTFGALFFAGLTTAQLVAGLLALTVVDALLLKLVVKRVLICYRCKAQFRGVPPGARCRPFDLATWEAHTPPASG